jgi:FemAB-related protein (PEP-CTERM system-associated)
MRQPNATLYHLHAWRSIARRAYDLDAPFLVSRDAADGPVRGVLPLFRIPRPFSPYLTNGLFGAYGDLLADDPVHAGALVSAAVESVDRGFGDYLHLKLLGDLPRAGLERKDIWVTARLSLGSSEEATWAKLPTAMRTKIRHAQKAGFVTSREADVGGFYDVLSENMLRKGAPIYGRSFFTALLDELGSRAGVVTLSLDGRVVSGAFVAWVHDAMYVPFASSRADVFSLKVNQLLWWEIARYAHALGLRVLDFGSSMQGSTGLEFKKHWRTDVSPIASYLYARPGVRPVLAPAESVVARTTVRAWSHLPAGWAEALGPRIARWIA